MSLGFAVALSLATVMTLGQAAAVQDGAHDQPPTPTAVRGRFLEIIFNPPKPDAPFNLTLDTEWSRPSSSGGTYGLVNERHIARQGAGAFYEERRLLEPMGGKDSSIMTYIQIADFIPVYPLQLQNGRRKNLLSAGLFRFRFGNLSPAVQLTGPPPNGAGSHTDENLSRNSIIGFETTGYRETTTFIPGVYGNGPRSGKQTFTVTVVRASEPGAKLFTLPEAYAVVDRNQTQPSGR